ncbi:hypothetical protein K402DRAFT_409737 [Aulographum hederae CBS 113979]|uniref:tRNA wybutosine-synthesizing protein 3 n=1 Tax=Aulographum hederae CBS 113979 TaxID=1176131 RepID=A0A6G1HEW3_9PEZI|nr:hypothetical protein K402DRAFT_409737 [Aulographum hederae CBS 113979]
MSSNFQLKKQKILQQLNVPVHEYTDLSPKGSVDEGIRELVDEVNAIPGLVTTSSCAGRVAVFLEGAKKDASADITVDSQPFAGPGGKGGGRWLYISHEPIDVKEELGNLSLYEFLGFESAPARSAQEIHPNVNQRTVRFKFEPMILHVLTGSLDDAQKVITAALAAGFRESGAVGLAPNHDGSVTPVVSVRTNGLTFDSIVGYETNTSSLRTIVDEAYLLHLCLTANERFNENTSRIQRFREALKSRYQRTSSEKKGTNWEDSNLRRDRKRQEGLQKQLLLRSFDNASSPSAKVEDSQEHIDTGLFDG